MIRTKDSPHDNAAEHEYASPPAPAVDNAFVLMLAHELRNLLSPLSSCSDLLCMPDVDARSRRRIGEIIARQVRQLRRLTNDLLDAHRLDMQQLQLVRRSIDLNAALEAICEDHRPAFCAAGIALRFHGTNAPLLLQVDLGRIEQVVNNLLSNSLKFTDRGGRVDVSLFVDGTSRSAVVAVQDTGVGIEHALLDVILTSDTHDVSCRNRAGLGLGLPLAKRLVELHGGHLAAYSHGIGEGSEFRVTLPLTGT